MRHSLLPRVSRTPHYGAVLGVLLLMIVVAPLSTGPESEFVVEVFFNLVLVTAAYSAAAMGGPGSVWYTLLGRDDCAAGGAPHQGE